MRRVYLSFLGTSDYKPCIYTRNGYSSGIVRFVQEATLGLCCADWTPEDRIVLFTTQEAREKNWEDNGHVDPKTRKRPEREGLCKCIERMELKPGVERVDIPEGKSEVEIWEIFGKVFEKLTDHDEVVFDITHAFRSIPMLAIVILNYAKILKEIKLIGIYYGAFEVLGSLQEADKMPAKDRLVPILDFTAFDQLLDWSLAIDRFIKAGDARLIEELARGGLSRILAETDGQDKDAKAIRRIGSSLSSFGKAMATCRVREIGEIGTRLRSQIQACENAKPLAPFQPLFMRLEKEFSPFCGDMFKDGLTAVKWCLNHNLIQQGVTILRELFLSYVMTSAGRDWNDPDEREEGAARALGSLSSRYYKKGGDEHAGDSGEGIRCYTELCERWPQLPKFWGPLAQTRNDLNHGGMKRDPKKAEFFSRELAKYIAQLEALLILSK